MPEVRWSFIICTVRFKSAKFAVRMMQDDPQMISVSAGRSNLHRITSLRKMMERITWKTIAVVALNDSRTMSAKAVIPIVI